MKNTYQFSTKEKDYELFFGNEHIELYETNNPKEGLIFENNKNFNRFINLIIDILEKRQAEENG